MNAVPPKGQIPQQGSGNPPGEPIHLTMSFEDDMGEEQAIEQPEPAADQRPEKAARRTQSGQARTDPADAQAAEPILPPRSRLKPQAEERAEHQVQERTQSDHSAGPASPAAAAMPRGALPPQFAQIELSLTVEVGSLNISLKELMSVEPGQLLALDRMTDEPVSVLVNGKPFARGEIVAVGDRYGVRLLEIVSSSGTDS